jgi:feruloyl esterase
MEQPHRWPATPSGLAVVERSVAAGVALALVAGAALAAAPVHRVGALTAGVARAGQSPVVSCEALLQQALPQARITTSVTVKAEGDQPAHCRVSVTLTPSTDSDIKMQLWLPLSGWNGKFMMVGNGGWSGAVPMPAMSEPLRRGYAVAGTDTGHEGGRGSFAFGHPEKLIDFSHRAVHETVVKGKALTAAFYGGQPRYAYWNGCSSGGKQGLKAVQQYPEDFDGVVVGAPANDWMRQQTRWTSTLVANLPKDKPAVLGPDQFALLHKGVLAQCDARDGLKDGEIQDPRACDFKASSLACKAGDAPGSCLTAEQVAVADRISGALRNPKTGELISPGLAPGSESGWGSSVSRLSDVAVDTFAVALNAPQWDLYSLDPARDLIAARRGAPGLDALNTDLSAFKSRGGRIVSYHGWADPGIPTEQTVNYYESVVAKQGGLPQTQSFYRLFLVPAMGHCSGAYTADWISTLEQWVEGARAPDVVLAQRLATRGTRPICAYPAVARLQGGTGEQPVDWVCSAAPARLP